MKQNVQQYAYPQQQDQCAPSVSPTVEPVKWCTAEGQLLPFDGLLSIDGWAAVALWRSLQCPRPLREREDQHGGLYRAEDLDEHYTDDGELPDNHTHNTPLTKIQRLYAGCCGFLCRDTEQTIPDPHVLRPTADGSAKKAAFHAKHISNHKLDGSFLDSKSTRDPRGPSSST